MVHSGLTIKERLLPLRRAQSSAGPVCAQWVGLHVSPIRRDSESQPALHVRRHLAHAFSLGADMLSFAFYGRGSEVDLRLPFAVASRLHENANYHLRSVNESMILRNSFNAAERRFTTVDYGASSHGSENLA